MAAAAERMALRGSPRTVSLPATLLADAIDLKGVPRGRVMMFPADLLFQFVHFGTEELDRATALRADHVMVAAPIELMFVAGDAVVKRDRARQSAFRE